MEREEEAVEFSKNLVAKLLNMHLEADKTKVSGDSLLLLAELLKVFVYANLPKEGYKRHVLHLCLKIQARRLKLHH
ncbi:centromere protein X isoform X3 [Rhinoderma darwinii]|uniref:centromere protein X isoform X3 n=1 Tax=Rhinoderma darwinii TaxID=43563 RepID=UPI003F6689CF